MAESLPSPIEVIIASHRGHVRAHNEDSVGVNGWALTGASPRLVSLTFHGQAPLAVAICDGMGGHAGGATASAIAAERVTDTLSAHDFGCDEISVVVQRASDDINDLSESTVDLHGLGTTIVGLHIRSDGTAVVFNVGDSRAYRLESGFLGQLTVDHRTVASNTLTQALGGGRRTVILPDYFACVIEEGAGIVLCSDGLSDYVAEDQIHAEMAADDDRMLPSRLVSRALDAGGGDNISVIQVRLAAAKDPSSLRGRHSPHHEGEP